MKTWSERRNSNKSMLKHVYCFELTKIYIIFIIKIVFINCLTIEFYRGFYLQKTQNITKGSTLQWSVAIWCGAQKIQMNLVIILGVCSTFIKVQLVSFSLLFTGEGNATHSSVLAWRIPGTADGAAVDGVAQSRTRLKWLSSSSNSLLSEIVCSTLYSLGAKTTSCIRKFSRFSPN